MSPRRARRLPPWIPRRPRGGPAGAGPGPGGSPDAEGPALRLGPERLESGPDGDWVMRAVPGSAAVKTYRCPGCDQEILPGTAHVVAWPAGDPQAQGRRHWHRPCWERRAHRRRTSRKGWG